MELFTLGELVEINLWSAREKPGVLMVVHERAVELKLRVEGIGVERFRVVMVKRLLVVVKRKLVVQGGLFWNWLKRKLSAGRPVGAAGAGDWPFAP